jgi:hypothetical protein
MRALAHTSWLGQRRLAGLGPSGTRGRERRAARGRKLARAELGRKLKREKTIPFLFLFTIFQSIFKWNFEILFEFSNRAHNTKYYAAA